jgi:hypothetical protein
MFVGVAVPLGILLAVIAGVAFGVWRSSSRPARARATPRWTPWRRAAKAPAPPPEPKGMPLAKGGATFACRLAGTAYRQEALSALRAELLRMPRDKRVAGRCGAFIAELRPDPGNPHDQGAVAVEAAGYGTVGWLPRGEGARYTPLLQSMQARGLRPQCPAEICKGPDGTLGVRLDLATAAAVAARLGVKLDDFPCAALASGTDADHPVHAST